jgi:DNA mismatch repair protein MutL
MGKIRVLSDQLINQIAAGEIVERPASVVKELVENSLDAGATRIEAEIEGGGKTRLTIRDDGEGMTRDDALLAFEHHATSKLRRVEELAQIATLGFRGEALPSIAAVSRLTLRTVSAEAPAGSAGTLVEIHGGTVRAVKDIPWARGTEITAADLFYNLPARRKFLKTDATESSHVGRLFTHYALAWPDRHFSLASNGRTALDAPPVKDLRERTYQIFGEEFMEGMLPFDVREGAVRFHGLVAKPHQRRSSTEAQYFFVNGRMVRDRMLSGALYYAYRTLLPGGTYPAAILFLEIPSEEVDVNVHPAKTEIRFRQVFQVQGFIRRTLETALQGSRSFARLIDDGAPATVEPERESPYPPAIPLSDPAGDYRQRVRDRLEEYETRPPSAAGRLLPSYPSTEDDPLVRMGLPADEGIGLPIPPPVGLPAAATEWRVLGQWRESFIVATSREELLLIDQHVAHERVLFESYLRQLEAGAVPRQRLLAPVTVELPPAQRLRLEELPAQFEAAGFEVEPFGGGSLAIKAVPALAAACEIDLLILDILDRVGDQPPSFTLAEVRHRAAAALACRAAVKINTPLAVPAMERLLDTLLAAEDPTTCPHGRPVVLRLHIRDLEKGFKRV